MIYLLILFLILLVGISAFLSASETALFSLSPLKLNKFQHSSLKHEQHISQLLLQPQRLLITLLILNITANILIQNLVSGIFGENASWLLAVGVPLLITLLFGEIIPKSIAYQKNELIAQSIAPYIQKATKLSTPFRRILIYISNKISNYLFFFLKQESTMTIEELKTTLRSLQTTQTITPEESRLVRGYLNLGEDRVKELMCPRHDIVFFNINAPLTHLISLFVDHKHTCIPICNGNLEHVLGIASSDHFFLHQEHIQTSHDIIPFLTPPYYIPESMTAKHLTKHLYDIEQSLVLVVDEYGLTSGLITLEDVLETLIGHIAHRTDEPSHYHQTSSNILIARGSMELLDFEDLFEYHLTSPNNMATIGGWLTEIFGDIPCAGSSIKKHGFLFHILAASPTRIERVYIRRLTTKHNQSS